MFTPAYETGSLSVRADGAIWLCGNRIHLTEKEQECMEILVSHVGKVVTSRTMFEHVFPVGPKRDQRTIHIFVWRIRNKILSEDEKLRGVLESVPGRGHRLGRIPMPTRPLPDFLPTQPRWVSSRKSQVVVALQTGKVTREELFSYYPDLSDLELDEWIQSFCLHGCPGLRATKSHYYQLA